jgi:FtsH-binding integral membrane protein
VLANEVTVREDDLGEEFLEEIAMAERRTNLAISAAVVGIFSAYILYDINRIVHGGETSYVTATLAVYLDVYNVFVGLLQLIMAFTGERD